MHPPTIQTATPLRDSFFLRHFCPTYLAFPPQSLQCICHDTDIYTTIDHLTPLPSTHSGTSSRRCPSSTINLVSNQKHTSPSRLEKQSSSTYMPNINPQHKRILTTSLRRAQNSHSHNIVEPIVVFIASLKHDAKLQAARRLRGPRSLQQDVRPVVRAEVVASVGAEDACLGVCDSPICAEVQDLALGSH
jgi:hypothetical protein